jgi:hypothetical protein
LRLLRQLPLVRGGPLSNRSGRTPTIIVAIDPGERIGLAVFHEDGSLKSKEVIDYPELLHRMAVWEALGRVHELICERWAFQPGKTKGGDTMVSSRVIGALEYFASRQHLTIHFQEPGILDIAAMHAGEKVRKGHYPDDVSAYLHGHHWLIGQGVLESRVVW